jgi:hypothetical protein
MIPVAVQDLHISVEVPRGLSEGPEIEIPFGPKDLACRPEPSLFVPYTPSEQHDSGPCVAREMLVIAA